MSDSKAWFVEGLRLLPVKLRDIQSYHLGSVLASRSCRTGDLLADAAEYRKHPDAIAWKAYQNEIVQELDAAVRLSIEFAVDLPSCRKLSIALAQGFYEDGSPLILDAITEVCSVADKLSIGIDTDPIMEKAIQFFIETSLSWDDIRIEVGCTADTKKGFENNVRRYFEKTRGKKLSDVHVRSPGMRPNRNR